MVNQKKHQFDVVFVDGAVYRRFVHQEQCKTSTTFEFF
jgi:hypothetical protein